MTKRQNNLENAHSGYRTHSDQRLGITLTRENGAQDIGRHAVKQLLRMKRGEEPTAPQGPDDHLIVTRYEDGSFDTGTRAILNAVRAARGKKPKTYTRTFHPID